MFISKCTEAKNICYQCVTIVRDDVLLMMLWDECILIPIFILYDGWGGGNGYFWSRASNTVPRLFHMALGGCRARVEVLEDELFADMGTPFEESLSCGLEELGYCRIA